MTTDRDTLATANDLFELLGFLSCCPGVHSGGENCLAPARTARWLAEHDRAVRAEALNDAADHIQSLPLAAYDYNGGSQTIAYLRARAARATKQWGDDN